MSRLGRRQPFPPIILRNPLEPPPPPPFVRNKIYIVQHNNRLERRPGEIFFRRNAQEQPDFDDRGPGAFQLRMREDLADRRRDGGVLFIRNRTFEPPPEAFAPAVRIHVFGSQKLNRPPAREARYTARAPDVPAAPEAFGPASSRIHVFNRRRRRDPAVPVVTFIRNAPETPAAPGSPESDNRLWQDIFQWTNFIR